MNVEHRCFADLVPLAALDLLNQQDQLWCEAQMQALPELAAELEEFQRTVGAIAYSAPTVTMAADLKNRLFQCLGVDFPSASLAMPNLEVTEAPDTIPVPSQLIQFATGDRLQMRQLNWQPHAVALGVEIACLHLDHAKRTVVGFLKASAGVHYPLHRHASTEELFMLAGDLTVGDRVYGCGDYIRSEPGSVHAPFTVGGCMFFYRTSLDDEILDELTVGI